MMVDLPAQDIRPTRARHFQRFGPLRIAKFFVDRFATFDGRRDPPNETKTKHARFITVKVSHYCEKGALGVGSA